MTVSRTIMLVMIVAIYPSIAHAQHYVMRDGTVLEAAAVERRDSMIVERLTEAGEEGVAERLHACSDVVRLEWPEPDALAAAREYFEKGAAEEALTLVEPLIHEFAMFAGVEGSWWDEAALLKAQALLAVGRSAEATPVVQALLANRPTTEVKQLGRLLFVEIDLLAGRVELASTMLEQIVRDEVLPGELAARAWWLRGEVLSRQGKHEQALEAYLHVPAFFGRERARRPAVLLGASAAYRKIGDRERADRSLNRLIREYPQHPLAARAREQMGTSDS